MKTMALISVAGLSTFGILVSAAPRNSHPSVVQSGLIQETKQDSHFFRGAGRASSDLAMLIKVDRSSGQITVTEASEVMGGIVDRTSFGLVQIPSTERILGTQFLQRQGRGSADLVVIVTLDSLTGQIFTYDASENIQVDRTYFGKIKKVGSEEIVGAKLMRGAGRGSSDLVILTALDSLSNQVVIYEISQLGSGIVDRRSFGRVQLSDSERVIGTEFLRGAGRASSDLSEIVTIDSKTKIISLIASSSVSGGIVDRSGFGIANFQVGEKILGAQIVRGAGRASSDLIAVVAVDSTTGHIVVNEASGISGGIVDRMSFGYSNRISSGAKSCPAVLAASRN